MNSMPGSRSGDITLKGEMWVRKELARLSGTGVNQDVFGQHKIFVTCQIDDDVPYILGYAGDRSLVNGTGYGHADP